MPIFTVNKQAGSNFKIHNNTALYNESYGNNTDSQFFTNESYRINDFVIDRDSMQFRKVPSTTKGQTDRRTYQASGLNGIENV